MKRYKRFCAAILCVLLLLVLYSAAVWHFRTREILTRADGYFTGDLARVGYLPEYAAKRRNIDDLSRRHVEMADYDGRRVDVITIGDSFSQGGGAGPNRFYQDYLATFSGVEVLNVPRYPGKKDVIETALILLNSGFLDAARPKVLLLEMVERSCYNYAGTVDWEKHVSLDELRQAYAARERRPADDEEEADLPPVSFINTGNFKWLFYQALYPFAPNAFVSDTYKVRLDRHLFSGEKGDALLFLRKDITKSRKADPETIGRVNQNLNRLAELLRSKGVDLCFLPVPDKYSLYSPYIPENPFPRSRFFELLRPLAKEYRFIDAEAILRAELTKGEKDIYYQDDTHWSWKASRVIFAREKFTPDETRVDSGERSVL